jgi:voltage-gated potassium channel
MPSKHVLQIARIISTMLLLYLGLSLAIFLVEAGADKPSIDSYPHAMWYTLVTFSTVGYGDMYPVTTLGKVVGGVIIVCSVGFISYAVGKLGDQLLENNRRKFLGMDGTRFKHHYIVVGWNEVSRVVVEEILAAGFKAAILTDEESDITEIRSVFDNDNLFVAFGLYESDAVYRNLNIDDAAGAILMCNDDTRTLVIVLHLRELRPDMKITAYIQNSRLRRTVENAGVSYVVSPNEVIGRMIASATFEPDVSAFLEDILSTTTADDDLDLQEYQLRAGHEIVGMRFRDAYDAISERTGARLLTFSRRDGAAWHVSKNSDPAQLLRADDYLIVIVNHDAARKLSDYLGVSQGRKI